MSKKYNGNLSNIAMLDEKTGEIVGYLTNKEVKELDSKRTSAGISNDKLNDNIKKAGGDLFKEFVEKEFGSFYFSFYNKLIDLQYIFRFIYLCTHMNYKNYITLGNAGGENKLATRKDLHEILEPLSRRTVDDTIKYLIENRLIEVTKEGYILVNKTYCNRGKTKNLKGSVKMIDKNIQELYKNSTAKEHNTIDLLIKLLPHVNFKYNIVCTNPKEEELELIKPMKQIEILKLLGISKPTSKQLVSFKIHNGTESAFCKISNAFVTNAFMINPRFCFSTNNLEDLEEDLFIFKVGSKVKKESKN